MLYLYVGMAGALGALARYGLGVAIGAVWTNAFPIGTLVINLIGSFILGWMTHFLFQTGKLTPQVVTAVGTGMIGSFTTFSTFSVETIQLIDMGKADQAIGYVLLSAGLGLYSSYLGYHFGTKRLRHQRGGEMS